MESTIQDDQDQSDENLKTFFLQEKPADMIVILSRQGTSYASELSDKADTTYSHAVKVMNRMKARGLVDSEKKGRKKEYHLTQKGEDVADQFLTLFEEVDGFNIDDYEENTKWGLDKIKEGP